jgi:DMSO reductase anchor subunit
MSTTPRQPDGATLTKRGVAALVLALVVNLGLLTVVLQLDLVAEYDSLEYPPVALFTTLGVVGGTVVYAVLSRRAERFDRLYVRIALAALVVSFVPNVAVFVSDDAATVGVTVATASLHVPPAAACIGVLTGWLTDG